MSVFYKIIPLTNAVRQYIFAQMRARQPLGELIVILVVRRSGARFVNHHLA